MEKEWHPVTGALCNKATWRNGLLHGKCKRWNPDGVVDVVGRYANGNLHGALKYFNLDGSLARVEFYSNGKKLPTENPISPLVQHHQASQSTRSNAALMETSVSPVDSRYNFFDQSQLCQMDRAQLLVVDNKNMGQTKRLRAERKISF